MLKVLGLLLFSSLLAVHGDEYFYNMKKWVQPVFKLVPSGAHRGMDSSPPLLNVLGVQDVEIEKLDREIRDKVAKHLQVEMGTILTEMQSLITIVKEFSVDLARKVNKAVNTISAGGAPQDVGEQFLDDLILRAKGAINRIMVDLQYEESMAKSVEDHLSAKVFQAMAVRIAREVLEGSELVNVEKSVLEQVRGVLDLVFDNEDHALEESLMTDLMNDLHPMFKQLAPKITGKEKVFTSWLNTLISNAVQGAEPQMQQLRGYAKQVISEACKLCHDVCAKAYKYFSIHRNEMGPVWDRMDSIVKLILDENKQI